MTTHSCTDQHHPELYYEDGNVVLSAIAQDGRRQFFRVHQSILCRHSPVFAQMFDIPPLRTSGSKDAIAETYEDVVHIQMPDNAEDLASFLGVLYDPLFVPRLSANAFLND